MPAFADTVVRHRLCGIHLVLERCQPRLCALDVDAKPGKPSGFEWLAKHGRTVPSPSQRSRTTGRHALSILPQRWANTIRQEPLAPGIELKLRSIAVFSLLPGAEDAWAWEPAVAKALEPVEALFGMLALTPNWVLEVAQQRARNRSKQRQTVKPSPRASEQRLARITANVAALTENRNDGLARWAFIAGLDVRDGWFDADVAEDALLEAAAVSVPDEPDKSAETIRRCLAKGMEAGA